MLASSRLRNAYPKLKRLSRKFDSGGNLFIYNVSDPQTCLFETNTFCPAGSDANCYMENGSLLVERQGVKHNGVRRQGGHPDAFLRVEDDR